jgi:UDP-N-acetylmuramoyl-L-alanyl-D-glutamate--2,6-diaminopimelate ligase
VGGKMHRGISLLEVIRKADLASTRPVCELPADIRITSVTDDSREVQPGSCFVAVSGDTCDGRAYVDEAVRRGAVAVVAEADASGSGDACSISVVDARTALLRLSAAFHGFAGCSAERKLKLIGVTGTNGKTTTALMIRSILSAAGHPTALLGTLRYDLVGDVLPAPWTTPPAAQMFAYLARAAEHGATHAVAEVSSHALAQGRCDGRVFDAAVFTNLSGDHLDYHGDFDGYLRAKKSLFDTLSAEAVAVVNGDDVFGRSIVASSRAKLLRFSVGGVGEVCARVESMTLSGSRFVSSFGGESLRVSLPLAGVHNVYNALAAATAALGIGVCAGDVQKGLESIAAIPGRLQRVGSGEGDFSVFVDYAHTDDALVNVLASLRPLTRGRVICVFGCGGDRDRSKRPRMARAAAGGADVLVVTSDNPRHEDPQAIIEEICAGLDKGDRVRTKVEVDRGEAIALALSMAKPGDTVLIAGKGHEDYQIVGDDRLDFDDVEVVSRIMSGAGRTVTKKETVRP